MFYELSKVVVFYASYLIVPALLYFGWLGFRAQGVMRALVVVGFFTFALAFYARFIEPQILTTRDHDVALDACYDQSGQVKMAVFSDTHLGLYKNAISMTRIAKRINKADPDFTLIAGDFVYFLSEDKFDDALGALKDIDKPVYAVLGNHDNGYPGKDVSSPLVKALSRNGVSVVDNKPHLLADEGYVVDLVGIADDWSRRQAMELLATQTYRPRFVLTHNPVSVVNFPKEGDVALTIGGHTHGGQVNLPYITCRFTLMCGSRRYGLSRSHDSYPIKNLVDTSPRRWAVDKSVKNHLIFTTSGTGMVGLPLRFRVPPVIDVLKVTWSACSSISTDI